MKKFVIALLCSILAMPVMSAGSINTLTLTRSIISPSCMDWRVVGICYWLYCGYGGCRIRTSIKVRHYIPEAVVSSYKLTGQNPWIEMRPLSQPNSFAEDGGNVMTPGKGRDNLPRFKNVDIIGHPGSLANTALSNVGYMCKSATTAFVPYFLSTLDFFSWRDGLPEMIYPQTYIPGMREIGTMFLNTWGSVYPRVGFIVQPDDFKAAAVTATRAANVVSQRGQPHVYLSILGKASDGYWPPGEVVENDVMTHKWQPLYPKMSMSCDIFPTETVQDEQGSYAWTLWRPYRCCKRRGQTFLGSTGH